MAQQTLTNGETYGSHRSKANANFTELYAPFVGALSAVTYDSQSRVTGYTLAGTSYVVAYPSSTSITVTGGGKVTTVTLDSSGRVTAKTVA